MGFISRKVFPACGNMCVCCPALRPSSRQPVKRYKKLLGDIFPKSINEAPNERKIIKLCEYAARNPLRMPKIAKFLEQRSYKELKLEHVNYLKIISSTYDRLLCICKEQMSYFATSLLNVIVALLDDKRKDDIRIIGCQTFTAFIYSQADSTYTHNIDSLVGKVCSLARDEGEDHSVQCLRATSLECLSAMVWFMSTFSYISTRFDEIVHVTLDNYESGSSLLNDDSDENGSSNHNWVEAVRSDVRDTPVVCSDIIPKNALRPWPEIKISPRMTKEEIENPKIWAQFCLQKIVEMVKESITVRHILDPMFNYFDTGKHWDPRRGLSVFVLSDVTHFMKCSDHHQAVLAAIIRYLDHKNVAHDPRMKSDIIQVATSLIKQSTLRTGVSEIATISDLCKHLRKSLQATVELVGLQESNRNITLQNSIVDCLLEISKGIDDAQPLFDMMTIILEELSATGVVARATIGSLLILAHIISSSSVYSHLQIFPESLFLQLLKTMMHPDIETRVAAHRIFSVLVIRTSSNPQKRHEGAYFKPDCMFEPKGWQSRTASAFVSATSLLEKLRREKESESGNVDDTREKDTIEEDWTHSWTSRSSPNVYKLGSTTTSTMAEPNIVPLSDDQIAQLLSAFWIQANESDNLPSNFEAIAYSYSLTLLSARLKNSNHNNVVHIFQLPLSLWNLSLYHDGVQPLGQLSLFTLSISMLMFGGKTYDIPELCSTLKSLASKYVDPYLSIGEDFLLFVKPQVNIKEHGSKADDATAMFSFQSLRMEVEEMDQYLLSTISQCLSSLTGVEVDQLARQLSETFTPDDGLLFGPNSVLDWFHNRAVAHTDESLSLDEGFSRCSSINGDEASASSPGHENSSQLISRMPPTPSSTHVISVGQLLESALQVAGQVAGTTISTSPLPYGTMTSQCEALGMGTRKKLSSWLGSGHDLIPEEQTQDNAMAMKKIHEKTTMDPWLTTLILPPSSPFDNFLKAARY
ncbi:hypothetical protein ZOSMA_208G00490 [Zostera marina]|uniref:ARM repeat superfamily protein n=1 Tax=Zostera marina TaxID=29655 RepID=A0A0K9PLB7_ZOSMR|nr:hypothetical protein ZOSMA_208G00490 [Zostera marina]